LRKKPPKPATKRTRGALPKLRVDPATATLPFNLPVASRVVDALLTAPSTPIILRHLAPAKVSEVYESYWRFAAERQAIFFRRARGAARPWTPNAVLATYKFTNAYRASDRVSQYLIRHVIYRANLPNTPREVFFRILLFKLFNKVETWELLERSFGPITFEDYRFAHYDEVLAQAMRDGRSIYSAAYIMPPGSSAFGRSAKHQNHLLLLERMMEDRLPERLAQTRTMQEGFEKLRAYPTIGDFLAYQFITDINYSEITDFSEMDFVVPGPGARDGLRKCFADPGGLNEPELIRLMADLQEQEFQRLGLDFQSLWGRRLQLIDCQNLFCEVDKYARVAHPHIAGRTGRTRIKQKFEPTQARIELFYPPKWKLNEKIRASAETSAHAAGAVRAVVG
jgi:5-hmdU DNA kinase-like protein